MSKFISKERWTLWTQLLREKLEAIIEAIHGIPEPDLSALAKEATLNTKAQEILTKLGNTAQQGDNPSVTLTEVQERLFNLTNYATLAEVNEMLDDIYTPYN